MRVLVTRPLHSGQRTARRLRDMGHEPVLLPLSRPVHDPVAALTGLTNTDGAIAVTSAEAIHAIAARRTELAAHFNRHLFAVGEATAAQARAAGFRSVTPSGGSGNDLADAIAAKTHGPVLYLAGSPRAETFETRAGEVGLTVTVAESYRMEPVKVDAGMLRSILAGGRLDAVLFYSRQTAETFFHISEIEAHPDKVAGTRLLCLSASVAEAVPLFLRKNVGIAATPKECSLLSLL
ncbi:uroporphyrinogen-III synthase [Rhizobium sp. Root1220]|uniref:uroporphyrinogen-III synthase n=1 Tax=Rhizobium sp. Root1220 TaxID=1736432 RepID=UPI0006FE8481|nr:uroporphyrinogen-III synthase [Rhizobium sp. Root1220]KQV73189.1 uroporphyrinogen III synthase [Rhizobium sp. Root1220]